MLSGARFFIVAGAEVAGMCGRNMIVNMCVKCKKTVIVW